MAINKLLVCTFLLVNILILTTAVVYVRYGMIEHKINEVYLKWIPAVLLFMQSLFLYLYYRQTLLSEEARFALYMAIGFLLCIGGDVLLTYSEAKMFMAGMALFFVFYIVFGLVRVREIYRILRNRDSLEGYNFARLVKSKTVMFVFIFIELIVAGISFGFMIIQIIPNPTYDHPLFFVLVTVYFLTMIMSSTIHLMYLFIYRRAKNVLTYVGIFLFMLSDFLVVLNGVRYDNSGISYATIGLYWLAIVLIGNSAYLMEIERLDFFPW